MILLAVGCGGLQAPNYYEVFEMQGTPYERGWQHGRHFSDKIRSLYTMLLTTSIFPYMNRERPDVASVLVRYQDAQYLNGRFSEQMMLESAQNLLTTLPKDYIDEMQGVADGAGLPFEQILVLNTFFDTLMGFRAIVNYIKLIQAPALTSVEFFDGRGFDALSNPYEPSPYATAVEVPVDVQIRLIIVGQTLATDPASVRVQLDDRVFVSGDPAIQLAPTGSDGKGIEVIFTPPGGLPAASVHSLIVQAGDMHRIVDPPPVHARFMRDERIAFTTAGYGKKNYEVENIGAPDGRTQPPSIGFAVKDAATPDGRLRVASHFALLDSNTTHKHTVLFIHRPSQGKAFAYVGWAGVIWGTSGMNEDGLMYLFDTSDTLNNPFVKEFNEGLIFAKLMSAGIPVGIMGREMLIGSGSVQDALDYLARTPATFGWNFLLADRAKNIAAAEVDSNIDNKPDGGFHSYTSDPQNPANLDAWGRPLNSIGLGDQRMASHFLSNTNEIDYQIVTFHVRPQRYWSSFYFRSVRAFFRLEQELAARYGKLSFGDVVATLRTPDLVDHRDSMNAAVYEPESLMIHFAMGREPATDGPFHPFDLGKALGKAVAP